VVRRETKQKREEKGGRGEEDISSRLGGGKSKGEKARGTWGTWRRGDDVGLVLIKISSQKKFTGTSESKKEKDQRYKEESKSGIEGRTKLGKTAEKKRRMDNVRRTGIHGKNHQAKV